METIFMKTENSKTGQPHKFVRSLPFRLDLKSSNKHVLFTKIVYLLHLKKYEIAVQKQQIQNNSSNVK